MAAGAVMLRLRCDLSSHQQRLVHHQGFRQTVTPPGCLIAAAAAGAPNAGWPNAHTGHLAG
jgi:hypothetical protein